MNQTTQMHQIARELPEYEHFFTPYYSDGALDGIRKLGLVEFTILGNKLANRCFEYLRTNNLPIDYKGKQDNYDLVLTCSDLVIPGNILGKKMVLVQEGMTDPERFTFHLARTFRFLPRWIASTATTGLSDAYDYFCVASEGYRQVFVRKGARPEKVIVTGMPNFDNCAQYLNNSFPHRNYVLVCTSDSRETFMYENRKKFIEKALRVANGRQLIFRLHPNEKFSRAIAEIERYAPGAMVFTSGKTEEMIANCDVLITRFSSTVYVGLALGKEVYSDFDINELRRLTPVQNASGAKNIAAVCRRLLETKRAIRVPRKRRGVTRWRVLKRRVYATMVSSWFAGW
jgi:hypothetical protein